MYQPEKGESDNPHHTRKTSAREQSVVDVLDSERGRRQLAAHVGITVNLSSAYAGCARGWSSHLEPASRACFRLSRPARAKPYGHR